MKQRYPRKFKLLMIELYKTCVGEIDLIDVQMEMLYFLKDKPDGLFEYNNYRIDKEFKRLKDINFGFSKKSV